MCNGGSLVDCQTTINEILETTSKISAVFEISTICI